MSVRELKNLPSLCIKLNRRGHSYRCVFLDSLTIPSDIHCKLYSEGSGKKPTKQEEIDAVKMPGFVHPHTGHDEGHFTQKAKQQLEELKKRLDKPTIDNTEKKE